MRSRLMSLSVTMGLFVGFIAAAWAQSDNVERKPDSLTGTVVSYAGQPIPNASVKLISSSSENPVGEIVTSRLNGTFRLPLDWEKIDQARLSGATWKVVAEKEGYASNWKNVPELSSPEPIALPEQITIELLSARYEAYFSVVDAYATGADMASKTLFLFDFQPDDARMGVPGFFLNDLIDILNSKIHNDLWSYAPSVVNIRLQVKRCPDVPVKVRGDAIAYGRRLASPGVLWGNARETQNLSQYRLVLTGLIEQPVNFKPIVYQGDAYLKDPLSDSYLAFSAFVLGNYYLREEQGKDQEKAELCFIRAQGLNALPAPLSKKLEDLIKNLKEGRLTEGLTPIGGEKQ